MALRDVKGECGEEDERRVGGGTISTGSRSASWDWRPASSLVSTPDGNDSGDRLSVGDRLAVLG